MVKTTNVQKTWMGKTSTIQEFWLNIKQWEVAKFPSHFFINTILNFGQECGLLVYLHKLVFTNSERNELTEKLWQDYRDILAFWAQYVNRCKVEPWRHNSECLGNS